MLILREAGLRSTLVARVSMAGADVLTADDFNDPRLARHKKRPLVLIADEAAIDAHAGGYEGLLADPRWRRVVVVSPGMCPESDDPRLIRIERAHAARKIAHLLPEWQAPQA
ncbi:MAG: hypothetical protein KF730_05780 [Sphingomonas sp.]|uniref:hypothetical protein n=1 Tax=Sphingomonas sp. TaxID=28214 RepID=UPI0025EFBD98|nr:hypothetical protein [Sphingomonas sp.]MBX3564072.1 hypothetical protein [Sphingomonas sp.]